LDLDLVRLLGDFRLDLDLVRLDFDLVRLDLDLVRLDFDLVRLDLDLDLDFDFALVCSVELEPLPVCEIVLLNVLESSSELFEIVSNCLFIDARISVDSGSLILITESSGNFRKPSVSNKLGQLSS
jgi:hypothetical protein